MVIKVLGLGDSLSDYVPDGCSTVGVNDIFKHHPVEYLVCLDKPRVFSRERLEIIKQSNPVKFYSQIEEWKFMPNFHQIILSSVRHSVEQIDTGKYLQSNNSAFTATHVAYKSGASEIILYGVDFVNHPAFNDPKAEVKLRAALRSFYDLHLEFKKRGVKLYVSSKKSALAEFIPTL